MKNAETEHELSQNEAIVEQIQQGGDPDLSLSLQLYQLNHGLIEKSILRYMGMSEADDLRQECFFAVHDAAKHYQSDAGMTFASYLWLWVRAYCHRYLCNCCSPVKIGERQNMLIRKYQRILADYRKLHAGRDPTDFYLCDQLRISEGQLKQLRKDARAVNAVSLDKPLTTIGDGEELTLMDVIEDPGTGVEDLVIEGAFDRERAAAIRKALDALRPQERDVLMAYYFNGADTYKKAGKKLGISPQGVRRYLQSGMRALRTQKRFKELRSFVDLSPIFSDGISGTGVGSFNRNFTSATERAALRSIERERRRAAAKWKWLSDVLCDVEEVRAACGMTGGACTE